MPTYGYRCEKCGHEFDLWQRMSDEAKADCPVCGSSGRRLFFPAGIVFKGAGFYKTDSRKVASSDTSTSKPASPSTPKPASPSTSPSSTPSPPSTGTPPPSTTAAAAAAD